MLRLEYSERLYDVLNNTDLAFAIEDDVVTIDTDTPDETLASLRETVGEEARRLPYFSFEEFQATRREAGLGEIERISNFPTGNAGFLYMGGGLFIEQADAPDTGKYLLIIGNCDWISEDLAALELRLYKFALDECFELPTREEVENEITHYTVASKCTMDEFADDILKATGEVVDPGTDDEPNEDVLRDLTYAQLHTLASYCASVLVHWGEPKPPKGDTKKPEVSSARQMFYAKLQAFTQAAAELEHAFSQIESDEDHLAVERDYPFDKSFDELLHDIITWRDSVQGGIQ